MVIYQLWIHYYKIQLRLFIIILLFWNINAYSQSIFQLNTDTINSKDLLFQFEEDTLLQTKKKKKKKKIYFGEKTKKGLECRRCTICTNRTKKQNGFCRLEHTKQTNR